MILTIIYAWIDLDFIIDTYGYSFTDAKLYIWQQKATGPRVRENIVPLRYISRVLGLLRTTSNDTEIVQQLNASCSFNRERCLTNLSEILSRRDIVITAIRHPPVKHSSSLFPFPYH